LSLQSWRYDGFWKPQDMAQSSCVPLHVLVQFEQRSAIGAGAEKPS
jgi:hypothetical protein